MYPMQSGSWRPGFRLEGWGTVCQSVRCFQQIWMIFFDSPSLLPVHLYAAQWRALVFSEV